MWFKLDPYVKDLRLLRLFTTVKTQIGNKTTDQTNYMLT